MALSLEQYATYLDSREDLPWPVPPQATPVKARPHLTRLPQVRAVLWNVYGTLLSIPQGDLLFEHPQPFIMSNALEKTIQEFHASNTGRTRWEEDILGRRVLRPGDSVIINLDDGSGYCRFDFKTVMESGRSLVKRNIDICKLETYRITD